MTTEEKFVGPFRMLTQGELQNRYQHQPWYTKAWRCRHYIWVPFKVLKDRLHDTESPWGLLWSLRVGLAQSKMGYWYTSEEVVAMEGGDPWMDEPLTPEEEAILEKALNEEGEPF